MSNWRDRTDRDAIVRHHEPYKYKEKDFLFSKENKSPNDSFLRILLKYAPFAISGMLFSISILSVIFSLNSSGSLMNIFNSPKMKSLDIESGHKIGRAICEVDSSGEFFILVADSNGGIKKLLKFNSSYFSSEGYTPAKRCSQIAARVNTSIISGNEEYITANLTEGRGTLCISRKSQNECGIQDRITIISTCKKNGINDTGSDYFETCWAYKAKLASVSNAEQIEKEKTKIFTFPLNKFLFALE